MVDQGGNRLRNEETKRFTVSFDATESMWCLEEYSERLNLYIIMGWFQNWDTAQTLADMLNARNDDGSLKGLLGRLADV